MPKITKRMVDAAASDQKGRRLFVWDSQIMGFGLLVLPSGVKAYFYQYRTAEGKTRRATIGKHGDWTPDQARDKADELRQVVKVGRDPLKEKRERKNALTVNDLLDTYLESARFEDKAETTRAIDRGRIERHLKPALGKKHIHSLSTGDVERAFAAIRDGKTAADVKTRKRGRARVTGGEGTARMAIRLLRAVFGWALREGIAKSNPCEHVKTGADGNRDTILDGADDYARLFRTLDTMEAEKRIKAPVADAIRLIALTGARRGEVAGLRWQWVDLSTGRIVIPRGRHKTGKSTGRPRIISLPAAAQVIIARQPSGGPDDFVFRPAKGEGTIDLSHPWTAVRAEAELPAGIGLHGLRHSLASLMAMNGAQAAEIMVSLGHTQLSTAQRYIHFAQGARAALAERAAAPILAGMAASINDKSGEIVNFPKGTRGAG